MEKLISELSKKERMRVIGLMSGTSCDGVDAALCEISGSGVGGMKVELLAFHEEPLPDLLRSRLLELSNTRAGSVDLLCELNYRVGENFANVTENLLRIVGMESSQVDLIGSHGQTVAHLPPGPTTVSGNTNAFRKFGSTWQLGEPAVIAERIGLPVVANFRARDMAAGGQGAPLVPYVDYLLYTHQDRARVLVNIGGISNLTYLPARTSEADLLAFDSGPGNMVIDGLVQIITQKRQRYDKDANLAKQGRVDEYLLGELLKHPFLFQKPPKSTGRKDFGMKYTRKVFELGVKRGIKPTSILRTATEFAALTLSNAFKDFVLPFGKIDEVIVSGGGALNPLIMDSLKREMGQVAVVPSDVYDVPLQAKEAMSFAVLARETILGRPSNLPAATGAKGERILGQIVLP